MFSVVSFWPKLRPIPTFPGDGVENRDVTLNKTRNALPYWAIAFKIKARPSVFKIIRKQIHFVASTT